MTGFIGPFSHITSDVVCYVHTTNNQEENTWRVTQVNKHLGYEVLPHCLYYVDKITLVRRKKYKVQNISGKFSHLDIWKICMCNLHRHKSQFIKMVFCPKFQEEKKHGMCVLRACLHLRVGIGSLSIRMRPFQSFLYLSKQVVWRHCFFLLWKQF